MTTTAAQSINLSSKAIEDYELVQEAIAGDQKAYSELLNRYKTSVYHTILKMVNNRDDAEDLTLEAFGKAFNKLDSYAPRFAFSTWLFKIAINNCIDHIRKKRVQLLSIDEPIEINSEKDFAHNIRTSLLNPEEKFIREQKAQLLRELLSKINSKYRLMLELRFFEELSYEEIAEELDVPLGTVKAQLFRAKEIMFELLQTPAAKSFLEEPVKHRKLQKELAS